jgi:hypothetical protein
MKGKCAFNKFLFDFFLEGTGNLFIPTIDVEHCDVKVPNYEGRWIVIEFKETLEFGTISHFGIGKLVQYAGEAPSVPISGVHSPFSNSIGSGHPYSPSLVRKQQMYSPSFEGKSSAMRQ